MKKYLGYVVLLCAVVPARAAEDAPVPRPISKGPDVMLVLGPGEGTATPVKKCCSRAGAGNILITQPAPDTIVVTMTGAVVAAGHPCKNSVATYEFNLEQCFEVVVNSPQVKSARLVLDGQVMGVLRTSNHCCKPTGTAESEAAHAAIVCGPEQLVAISLPPRSASCGEDLSVYNRDGPVCVPVVPGKLALHQAFGIKAVQPCSPALCKGVSAEFAPSPAVEADWLSHFEPFHGANKKDFGFRVTIKVIPEY
jgi:hypothetical protein